MAYFEPRELSVIFLCYDEPERERFYVHLKDQINSAIKIEGVKGIDAAHKAAAAAATTERFILVDGDAIVDEAFWDQYPRIPQHYEDFGAWSFTARNIVNDTTYGPGGVKVFTRTFINEMKTHEASVTPETAFEFCWQDRYAHFSSIWSTTYINQSPFQAFRSGYREATKLLCPKCKLTPFEELPYYTQRKLVQWLTLGMDAENGQWVIWGAQAAYTDLLDEGADPLVVNDYDAIQARFDRVTQKNPEHPECAAFLDYSPFEPLETEASTLVKKYIRTKRENPVGFFTPCFEQTE